MILKKTLKTKVDITFMWVLVLLIPFLSLWICTHVDMVRQAWELILALGAEISFCSFPYWHASSQDWIHDSLLQPNNNNNSDDNINNVIYLVLGTYEALFPGLYTPLISFNFPNNPYEIHPIIIHYKEEKQSHREARQLWGGEWWRQDLQ